MNPADPAFPRVGYETQTDGWCHGHVGMSLRCYLAAKAMPGVLTQWGLLSSIVLKGKHEPFAELDAELAAAKAVEYADALIAELNQ